MARIGPARPRTCRPDYVFADKGCRSRANRVLLGRRGITHTIAQPTDQAANRRGKGSAGGRPVGFDKTRCTRRNVVGLGFYTSSGGAGWPPDTTSAPATTPAPSTSPHY